jgi:hypothetical protein
MRCGELVLNESNTMVSYIAQRFGASQPGFYPSRYGIQ